MSMTMTRMNCVATQRPLSTRAVSGMSGFMGQRIVSQRLIAAPRPVRQVTRMGLFGLGVPEIAVIAGVIALIYGPSKLPEVGKGLGKTFKSFQTAAKEFEKELKEEMKDDDATAEDGKIVKKE